MGPYVGILLSSPLSVPTLRIIVGFYLWAALTLLHYLSIIAAQLISHAINHFPTILYMLILRLSVTQVQMQPQSLSM